MQCSILKRIVPVLFSPRGFPHAISIVAVSQSLSCVKTKGSLPGYSIFPGGEGVIFKTPFRM